MNKKEETIMEKYGITYSTETVFHYKKYRYNNLIDAVNYAKIDMKRNTENATAQSEVDHKKIS